MRPLDGKGWVGSREHSEFGKAWNREGKGGIIRLKVIIKMHMKDLTVLFSLIRITSSIMIMEAHNSRDNKSQYEFVV